MESAGRFTGSQQDPVDILPGQVAAALERLFAASALDEDAAHGLGGSSEEVAAAVPVLGLVLIDEAEIGLVDESGGLQRLPWRFLGQPLGSQLAQLIVYQRQELLGSARIALLDGAQDLHDFLHEVKDIARVLAR